MQKSSKTILTLIFALVVLWIGYRLLFPPPVSDDRQIRNQIAGSISAAQDKNVSGIMAPVSDSFVDSNGYNSQQLRLMLSQSIHDYRSITVTPSNLTVSVSGDTAHSDEYLTITVVGMDEGSTFSRHGDFSLDWKLEPATRLLIIPTKTWRVVKAADVGILGPE